MSNAFNAYQTLICAESTIAMSFVDLDIGIIGDWAFIVAANSVQKLIINIHSFIIEIIYYQK
jgi:hypothetical protein